MSEARAAIMAMAKKLRHPSAVPASDMAVGQDVKGGAALMRFSYIGRLIALFVALVALVKSGAADPLACVLPVAFSHLIVTVPELGKRMGGSGG